MSANGTMGEKINRNETVNGKMKKKEERYKEHKKKEIRNGTGWSSKYYMQLPFNGFGLWFNGKMTTKEIKQWRQILMMNRENLLMRATKTQDGIGLTEAVVLGPGGGGEGCGCQVVH